MEFFEYIDIMNQPYEIHDEQVLTDTFYIRPHWHYFVEMLLITKGSIQLDCEHLSYIANAGDFLLIPPRMVHRIRHNHIFPSRYDVIKFDVNSIRMSSVYLPQIRRTLDQLLTNRQILFPAQEAKHTYIHAFNHIATELQSKQFGYEANVFNSLCMILLQLVRDLPADSRLASSLSVNGQYTDFFSAVLEYIDQHSAQSIQVTDLAKKSGMCYSNFAKRFKETYGRSCKEYIEYVKVSKAEELILYSQFDLNYIAQATGFADTSHMIRTYKKFKNETPKQARLRVNLHIDIN